MPLDDNNGTQYYEIPIRIVSPSPNLSANNGTSYYWSSPNDYILWCQSTQYTHPSSNNILNYYFYKCDTPSDVGLNISSNDGSKYYYNPLLNNILFEESEKIGDYENGGAFLYFDGSGNYYTLS